MLYPTLNQPLVLLIIFLVGLICGLIFDIAKILTTLSGGDKWSLHIFDFIATIICFLLLFFANLKFNLGQFRLYVLGVFLISFALQRYFSKFLWTKLLSKWYTSITKRRKIKIEKKQMDKHFVVGRSDDIDFDGDNNFNDSSLQTSKARRFKR